MDTDEWKEGKVFYGFDRNKVYGAQRPFQIFESFAIDNGLDMLNLYGVFKNAALGKKSPLFYPEDGHFTKAGHAVVAAALENKILKIYTEAEKRI